MRAIRLAIILLFFSLNTATAGLWDFGGAASDEAYDATTWDGVTTVAPSKNAVRDKIETIGSASVSDDIYGAGWNGVTTVAPSKNAVYDKIETIGSAAISDEAYDATTWDGVTATAPSKNAVRDKIETIGSASISDDVYGAGWNGVTAVGPSKNAVYDKIETVGSASVSDDVYGTGWNGVTAIAPSKNAVYDKIETIGSASISDAVYDATSWDGVTTIAPSKNAVRDKIEIMGDALISDAVYGAGWNGVTTVAPSKNAVYDKIETIGSSSVSDTAYSATTWNGVTTIAPSKNAVRDKIESFGTIVGRDVEDTLTDGSDVPDGHAVIDYGNTHWSGVLDTFTVVAMGQSNMVGYSGSGGDKSTDSRVTAWNGSSWVTANLNNAPFASGHNNIAFHFAKQVAEKQSRNVRIILEAENGRPISDWVPATGSHYVGMKNQISASGTTRVDVVLWHQGESDYTRSYAAYGADLSSLVTQLRGESEISETMPIVMGEIIAGGVYEKHNYVYERITDYVADSFVNVAKAKFLPSVGSYIHFSGDSLVVLGRSRYYTAMNNMHGLAAGHLGSAHVLEINACADKINNANLEIYDLLLEVANGNTRARRPTAQTISHNNWTIIQFNVEDWDLGNNFSSYRFTSTAAGYYSVTTQCMYNALSANSQITMISIFKNGVRTGIEDNKRGFSGYYVSVRTSGLIYLGVGDYVDARAFQYSGTNQSLVSTGTGETKQWFMVKRVL